ncbi:MAG: PspC domain-containing protein, partial [Gemmatimonadales bacterium]
MGTALTRSSSDKVIAGVCAGIANHLGWPVT